jgi:hypothetical protein
VVCPLSALAAGGLDFFLFFILGLVLPKVLRQIFPRLVLLSPLPMGIYHLLVIIKFSSETTNATF